jgi:hypothetical protein
MKFGAQVKTSSTCCLGVRRAKWRDARGCGHRGTPARGLQQSAPGGRIVRTIGIVRARAKIGLQNLAYNIRRLVTLERLAAA